MSSAEQQVVSVLGAGALVVLSLYFLLPHISSIGSATRGPVIPGLRNWANWCFCNSVLQSLSSLPSFRKWLDQNLGDDSSEKIEDEKAETSGLPLSQTMRSMVRLLNTEGPRKVLSSTPLVQALESVQQSRISRSQQDAQEFLHMLLESIAAEQNNLPASVSLQQMSTLAEKEGRAYKRLPFEGVLKNSSTCTVCKYELRAQSSPFLEITLLPPNSSRITVGECLEKTLQGEFIEDYNCVHCQIGLLQRHGHDVAKHQEALKKNPDYDLPKDLPKSHVVLQRTATISVLPQILILHINRSVFGSYATRNAIDVTYTEKTSIQGVEYELRSFVTHQGSHDRGHYISYRRQAGKWYCISDETVRSLDIETVLDMGGSTFLMFYERVDQEALLEKKRRKKRRKSRSKSVHEKESLDSLDSKM